MGGSRMAVPLAAAFACAIAALSSVPRAIESDALLQAQDNPVALADHQLSWTFNSERARREIEAALGAGDIDLATSFVDLARDRNVTIDPAPLARIDAANSTVAVASRAVGTFGRGFLLGESDDVVGLAGTALSDVLVI